MRNLFLLFLAIIMVCFLKEVHKNQKLEKFHIVKSQVVDFSGVVYLPSTLSVAEVKVNGDFIVLNIAGKNYKYLRFEKEFWLSKAGATVSVSVGDKIESNTPLTLYVRKEVK